MIYTGRVPRSGGHCFKNWRSEYKAQTHFGGGGSKRGGMRVQRVCYVQYGNLLFIGS